MTIHHRAVRIAADDWDALGRATPHRICAGWRCACTLLIPRVPRKGVVKTFIFDPCRGSLRGDGTRTRCGAASGTRLKGTL